MLDDRFMSDDRLIDEIGAAAKDAGEILLAAIRPKVMEKAGHANFCTETDEKIQAFLFARLGALLPNAAFLGEEDGRDVFTQKMGSGYCFVVDPIDGTSNFMHSYRPSVISIGLLRDGRPWLGVVYDPFDGLLFHAVSGRGAFLNGERILSSDAPLSDSLAAFGTTPYYEELHDRTFALARNLLPLCVDLRRSGSAAWDLCCVALGRCGLYFELQIQLWDYAAAALIAREAGCTVTDLGGNPLAWDGPTSILCRARGVKEIPSCFSIKNLL